jgi:stage IV sporulation protein FB
MRWSINLGRVAGIQLRVHLTFFLLLCLIAFQFGIRSGRWEGAIEGLILFACLSVIIVAHELGHALAARRFGIRTRDITLLPIGGVSRLERLPEKPTQELIVALAGPAVNIVLAAGIFVGLSRQRNPADWMEALQAGGSFADQLLIINIGLAVFNLLPAFPMDGGRVLRALLSFAIDRVQATQVAAWIGQGMAILFALASIFNPMLILIAIFVWVGARSEANMVWITWVLQDVTADRVMLTDFPALYPGATLAEAQQDIERGFAYDFPVVQKDELIGVVRRRDVKHAIKILPLNATIDSLIQHDFKPIGLHGSIESAVDQMWAGEWLALPVVDDGRLVGILTVDAIGELIRVNRSFLDNARSRTTNANKLSTTSTSRWPISRG